MKRALISSVSIVLTFGFAVPAFAYIVNSDFEKPSNRLQINAIEASTDIRKVDLRPVRRAIRNDRDIPVLRERNANNRSTSTTSTITNETHLERTTRNYNLRRDNRLVKPGSDRYRVLRPNTRYFRRQAEPTSALPPMIVQTGGAAYDRPTRRDIRGGNGDFLNVDSRDRDILAEIRNSR
ncbi:hypothetical protein KJ652_06880 [Patescibacteria group bacterium]|nr:hypothetical protein [Patescibacteria group bacterium]MBU1124273.1 hypothetical protein [Patescibacteria group bacterium]MBU1910946.1 hypothetical protein [Patescibacteria group bacterium]